MTGTTYLRPSWAQRVIGGRMARLFQPSVVCILTVRGRTTGQWRSAQVAVLEHGGKEYLMGAFGHTEWARNLSAAGSGRLTRHGQTEEFTAVEVPVEQRPPLIEAYLAAYGKLPTVARTFRALPAAADHPTFQITRRPPQASST
jgi:deazaflavin-dependent oxidoreductase (nitroreductase family)